MTTKTELGLIDKFELAVENAAASVERVEKTPEALNKALVRLTQDEDAVLLCEPVDIDPKLFSVYKKNKKVILKPGKDELKNTQVGITDAFCGIARTGSVCISITNSLNIPVSMLSRKHIVVIDGNAIIPRPADVFSEKYLRGKGLKGSFTIITGPSATADMGPLVRGVHGPGKLHIIVLE